MIPPYICACGYTMTATSGAGHDEIPNEKDVTICFSCARINIFNADLTQREVTPEEEKEIMGGPAWSAIKKARDIILLKITADT